MVSRRALASVADGTARAFTYRNNDVGGWWAPGMLLAAVPAGDPDYRIDAHPLDPSLNNSTFRVS